VGWIAFQDDSSVASRDLVQIFGDVVDKSKQILLIFPAALFEFGYANCKKNSMYL